MKLVLGGFLVMISLSRSWAADIKPFLCGAIIAFQDTTDTRFVIDSARMKFQDKVTKMTSVIDNKMDKFQYRLSRSTNKTLCRLVKWENRIRPILEKLNPSLAQQLFNGHGNTFQSLLTNWQKIEIIKRPGAAYNAYNDKLGNTLNFMNEACTSDKVKKALKNYNSLDSQQMRIAILKKMIRERKRELVNALLKVGAKSKYLEKIQRETYYYSEKIKNYELLFSDEKGIEERLSMILTTIPAFQKFCVTNSSLSKLFPLSTGDAYVNDPNLQSRQTIVDLLEQKMGGSKGVLQSQGAPYGNELNQKMRELKSKASNITGVNGDTEFPSFKPNSQRTKTFLQRLEYGFDFQLAKTNRSLPGGANLGITVAYRINDKSEIGLGLSNRIYLLFSPKVKIQINGIGVRSFLNWKLKKNISIYGGFEESIISIRSSDGMNSHQKWSPAVLTGIQKKVGFGKGLVKSAKLQLLYDWMHTNRNSNNSQVVVRMGYSF